ncbi:MAG: type III-B CRISPR module-associated protein Cmr3 [Betaproteobacteria bacterium]|nr:type III-B CRISPR module-associated protein Cmr3 [Betaproteobacteria bacterium]
MPEHRFVEPLDVLFARGNKLFGEAGQHGEAQMPPWPSVAAGAIRSRMLADADADLSAFARGEALADAALREALGTPAEPGSFRIGWFSLARRSGDAAEPLFALPADLNAIEKDDEIAYLNPQATPSKLKASAASERLAVLRCAKADKALGGLWLTGAGFAAYLRGENLHRQAHTMKTGDLWKTDARIGIALDPEKRSAAKGRLYTTEGIALGKINTQHSQFTGDDVGFVLSVAGADGLVPKDDLVRLGGDGRGARMETAMVSWPEPDWHRIAKERRFRLVLTTPGLFDGGWQPSGIQADGVTWYGPNNVRARLVSAAVPRAQVISGWDLAQRRPKAALRAAPMGTVYWLEAPNADGQALVAALRKLVEKGFGCLSGYPDRARLAEGFNNVMVANWAAGG